jgi:hypothetical protein
MAIGDHEIKSIVDWLGGKFKEGSADDLKARRTLARALRDRPLDRDLLFMLADLIDPDQRGDMGLWLVFKRPPGRRKTTNWRRVAAIIGMNAKPVNK